MSDCTIKLLLFWIVVCSYTHGMPGNKGSLCYLNKSQQQNVLCIPVTMDNCSSDYIDVTSVMVYVTSCSSASQCNSSQDCCSTSNVSPASDPVSVIWQCTTLQCLRGLNIFNLPETGTNYHAIEFTFNCGTSSSNESTDFQDGSNSGDSQTGVYVAVPVVLILLAIALASIIFLWRRKRQRSKQAENAETKDKFSSPAQNEHRKNHVEGDSISDESGFGDYSEINSDNIGERVKNDLAADTDYNTLNLRNLPTHSDPNYGFLAAKNSSADETYSSIQDEKTAETDDMYSHIGGAAQNVSDDVIPDHTYNTANVSSLTNDVLTEDGDTYNHLDGSINERISDKGKIGESDYAYSKFDSQAENISENTDESVRHDYFVLEKEF